MNSSKQSCLPRRGLMNRRNAALVTFALSLFLLGAISLSEVSRASSPLADQPPDAATLNNWTNIYPDIIDVSAVSGTEAWAAGNYGELLHYVGGSWTSVEVPAMHGIYPYDINMRTASDGWIAAGYRAFQYDGASWVEHSNGLGNSIAAIYGIAPVGPSDVWAVGWTIDGHGFMHWNGTSWSPFGPVLPANTYLGQIVFSSPTDGWATGQIFIGSNWYGVIYHFDGTSWQQVGNPAGSPVPRGLYASPTMPGEAWFTVAMSPGAGRVYHYLNGSWTFQSTPVNIVPGSIFMLNANEGWATIIQYGTGVLHYNGTSWNLEYPSTFYLRSVSGGVGTVWAVGNGGTVVSKLGAGEWTRDRGSPTFNNLNAVSALSANDAWAVGANNTALHWNGSTWQTVPAVLDSDYQDVQMLASNDVYAVGRNAVAHWDGTSWTRVALPPTTLNGIHMTSPGEGWAVGDDGAIWRGTGGSWAPFSTTITRTLQAVAMDSPTHGWAVGGDLNQQYSSIPALLEYTGGTWVDRSTTLLPAGVGNLEDIVLAPGGNEGWAVGQRLGNNERPVVHLLNGVWSIEPSINLAFFSSAAMLSTDDIWAIGGSTYHRTGGTWTQVSLPSGQSPNGAAFVPGFGGWAVGAYGTILRYDPPAGGPTPSPTTTPTAPQATATCAPGGGPYSIAIVFSDDAAPGKLINYINADPDVAGVGTIDARFSTPTLAQLLPFDLVVVFSNTEYADPVALGNVIADYQDAGGIVVATNANWYGPPYGMEGRWMTGGYTPFNYPAPTQNSTSTLGTYDPSHPLMQGVTELTAFFRNQMTLTAGASQVAAWADGWPLLAYKTTNGHTAVGINAYMGFPEEGWDGDFGTLIVNAARWLKPGAPCGSPTTQPTLTSTPVVPTSTSMPPSLTASATTTPQCPVVTWRTLPNPSTATLRAVEAISPQDIWAAGDEGGIFHYDGNAWVQVESPTTSEIMSISATSASDIWAAASSGVLHWDGVKWSYTLVGEPGKAYYGVVAISPDDVWAVGSGPRSGSFPIARTVHWDGSTWTEIPNPSPSAFTSTLVSVAASSSDDVWAVGSLFAIGSAPLLLHWDGTKWTDYSDVGPGVCGLIDVAVISPTNAWTVGVCTNTGSFVKHYDGNSWTEIDTPDIGALLSIYVSGPSEIWATGEDGILYWNGVTWDISYNAGQVDDIAPLAPDNVWAVGDVLLHYTPAFFTDVPPGHTFYPYVQCLACQNVISGYGDGTFGPNNLVTRGQLAKIVSNAAGLDDVPGPQLFTDVPPSHPFYPYIYRLATHGHMGGYPCGGPGEPCDPENRPYFRPFNSATRGQLSKIVSNTAGYSEDHTDQIFTDVPTTHPFYIWIERLATRAFIGGYPCGGPGEPCDEQNRPYFRPYNNVTRGQTAKIIVGPFFPECLPR